MERPAALFPDKPNERATAVFGAVGMYLNHVHTCC